jgi:hypothetical protein
MNIYCVDFCVVRKNTPPFSGASHQYRRQTRTALVSAANDQGIQAVLNADITLAGGETVEILHSHSVSLGTEGQAILA